MGKDKKKKRKAGSGIMKEMKCSDALRAVVGSKTISRGKMMKKLWEYIKGNDLQSSSNGQIIRCDDKLKALFGKTCAKEHTIESRGKKIKIAAGRIFMTEMAKPLNKNLSPIE